MIAVDSSAIFAVLFHENDHEMFAEIFAANNELVMIHPTLLECHFVAHGADENLGRQLLQQFVIGAGIKSVTFDFEMSQAAIDARYRYGKGSGHVASLNFGDCFSYALAKTRGIPLLYKGDDFSHTDIVSALDTTT